MNKHIESIKRKLGVISLAPNQPGDDPIESDDGSRLLIEIKNKTVSFPEALAILEDSDGFDGEVPSGTYTKYLEGLGYKIDESDVKELEKAGEYGTDYNSLMNIAYDIFYNGVGLSLPENDQVWEDLAYAFSRSEITNMREGGDYSDMEQVNNRLKSLTTMVSEYDNTIKNYILDYWRDKLDDEEDDAAHSDEDKDLQDIINRKVSFAEALQSLVETNGFDGKVPSGTYTEFLEQKGYSITYDDVKQLHASAEFMSGYTLLMNVAYDIFYAGDGHSLAENDSIWDDLASAYADTCIFQIENGESVNNLNINDEVKDYVENQITFARNISSTHENWVKSYILEHFGVDDEDDNNV